MSDQPSSSCSGPTLLFLVFLVLKLCHVIDWSWWWVTAPIWGLLALCLVLFAIAFILKKVS